MSVVSQTETPSNAVLRRREGLKVAYMMSRFPRLTETFVFREILAVEKLGVQVDIYPLRRERVSALHPEAAQLEKRSNYAPYFSLAVLWANLWCLCRAPWLYLATLATLLKANWGSTRYFLGAMAFFLKTVYFARRMAADNVSHLHAHFSSHPAAMAYVVHRLAGIPFSFTAHGSDLHCDRHMLKEKVAAAQFVTAISEYNRDLILEECGRQWAEKVIVVHCGIDPHVFPQRQGPTPFEQGGGPFSFLCLGTLHEVKGQTYLIQACRRLKERGVDFHCHFVGRGQDSAALAQQVAQAGLSGQVTFHGALPSHRIAGLFRTVDAQVAPSVPTAGGQREGIPVALMEGMASGTPVVASRLSGIPELVEHGVTGLLTPPRDADALAAALERLSADAALRQRLAQAARQTVLARFNLAANARRLAQRFGWKGGRP